MRKSRLIAAAAGVLVVALAATLAVLWPGYDARDLPPDNASVWVLQTGEGKRYARVNSDLGELDTVREVENPSGIAQFHDTALVFAEGNQRFATIDAASPQDLGEAQTDAFEQTPAETIQTVTAGEWIAYLTANGDVSVGKLGETSHPIAQDAPEGGETSTPQTVTAIGLSTSGEVALVTMPSNTVTFAHPHRSVATTWQLQTPLSRDVQLSQIGGTWVLLDEQQATLWVHGRSEPIATELGEGSLLQSSSDATSDIVIADAEGLVRVGLDGQGFARLTEASGSPARPISLDGVTYAAWASETQGVLWSAETGTVDLDFAGFELSDERQLAFMTNGSRMVLNEQYSGWVWSVPEGKLLPSSVQWTVDERVPQVTESSQTERVLDPKPPVAEPDSFGVRAGRSVMLPVLLNDHDPNEDVLSIIADSVTPLDAEFGVVTVANNAQQLVVDVDPEATGTATFSYAVTDGTSVGGLNSQPATVTLTVVQDDTNLAPEWCGTEGCLAEWPNLEVAPGETQSVNVLDGWVDPDGDPLFVSGTVTDVDYGQLIALPDGTVTYRHPDPSDTESRTIPVEIVVADAHGAETTKTLTVQVTPEPLFTLVPFVTSGAADTPITIDFTDAVRGASGAARLTSLTMLDDVANQPTISRSGLTATFTSTTAGNYLLQASVTDGTAEASGVIRVTVVDPAETPITTVPLTAFVRPGEDATVDVLPSVSDAARQVLLLDDLDVRPDGNAELSVDVIGQRFIRVMGDTETGDPGTLGTASYRVSDGSGSSSREARGEITFVLLPAVQAKPPIAVDDRVVVRTGEQIDIPVLDNDTAPAGSHVQLDPGAIVNEHDAGLAFATSRVVRYLAPDEPGQYTVTYQTSLLGSPTQSSTARIHITVNGGEGNTAPAAPTLEGRVRSGQTVSIPFDPFGADADGDVPRLDRVLTQPEHGTASISPEGDALLFTSAPGHSGQTHFTYRVRDSSGVTGVGTVQVGVLDSQTNPSPITYSDYVQVQYGEDNLVTVHPLDNDLDPASTQLAITRVVPNATPGSQEYASLAARLRNVDTDRGIVEIEGGTELGTHSYEYTAENERGDTSKGLIVVKVVREQVPSYPYVQDTVLTAETLQQLPDGIDVVSDNVSWNGGDTETLNMQLWGSWPTFETSGWEIRGTAAAERRVIPFSVSGTSFADDEVTSYGFLRVPGTDDLTLRLRSAFSLVEVKEDESVEINLSEAVRVPPGETLEVLASDVHASGSRSQASCTVTEGFIVRYTAGSGAPWQDVCTIPVKLAVQDEYTQLGLQVRVIARDPQPILRAATITVSPGDTQEYDLGNMVDWQGNDARPPITFDTSFSGGQFDVQQEGATLSVRAHDTAQPSRQETVEVTLNGPHESSQASLILTVGRSPQTLPKGATVAADCSQAGGATSCIVPVIGGSGEVNPFPNTPLTLASVSQPSNCEGVTMSVEDESRVRVNWADDIAGAADCRASFTATDAQGRSSTGGRAGQLIFDLQGLPANPTRLEWVSYTKDSVTLRPVSERSSIPQVSTYRVTGGGETKECPAREACTIRGLSNGEEVDFTAVAINSVGESRGSASVTAWAYERPQAPVASEVKWKPVPNDPRGGMVSIIVEVPDRSTESITVSGPDGIATRTEPVKAGQAKFDGFVLGHNDPVKLTVTPNTKFDVPPIGNGASTGETVSVKGVHGVGAPGIEARAVSNTVKQEITVEVTNVTNQGSRDTNIGYLLQGTNIGAGECTPAQQGTKHTFTKGDGVVAGGTYTVQVCARHVFDGAENFGTTTWSQDNVRLEIPTPQPATYTVGRGAVETEPGVWVWPSLTTTAKAAEGYALEFVLGNRTAVTLDELLPAPGETLNGQIMIRNCLTDGTACSEEAKLTATGATVSPKVTFDDIVGADGFCRAENLDDRVHVSGLPQNAYEVRTVSEPRREATERYVRVSFQNLGLDTVTSERCQIEPEPEPEPDPDPEPDPEPDPDPDPDPEESESADLPGIDSIFAPFVIERNGL